MSRHDTNPVSNWKRGDKIGPAARGKHRGQFAIILKNLGSIAPHGHISFLDTFIVRWDDGTEEQVKQDVFLW